jgi:hypothetical protein
MERGCPRGHLWIKCTGPTDFNKEDKPSAHSRNKYGEMGSPCRIPLVGLKASERTPLTLIEKETDVTHLITSETKFSWNPSFSIIPLR